MENSSPTRAVILAAGRGSRLIPHTNHVPKPLLPVRGRPTLDYIMEALARAGVRNACLVIGHLGEQIKSYVGDGARWGITPAFKYQPHLQGTADALRQASDFLSEPSFIVAADYILPPDYLSDLKQAYLAAATDLAVSLKQVPPSEMAQRNSILFSESGQIVRLVEKPTPGTAPSTISASLIYIVPPEIRLFLDNLLLSPRKEYELPDVINRMLAQEYTVTGLLQSPPPEWQAPEG